MRNKILFAVPTAESIHTSTVYSMLQICQRPDIEYFHIQGGPIEMVRNDCVRELLEDESLTHLMMMDSDVIPPEGIVDMLLECDSPMACGMAPIFIQGAITSNIQDATGHFIKAIDNTNGPFEVSAAGTGVVLIRREVFEKVKWPWFKRIDNPDHSKVIGEDIYFSRKAAKAGYKYMFNPKAICGHMKNLNLMKLVGAWNDKRNS